MKKSEAKFPVVKDYACPFPIHFGFRTPQGIEIALFHVLGRLPEPAFTQRFC
jgi:hypothetical protein